MANFFEKPWVAYVLPFLCILGFSEATFFLPHLRFRLLIGAGLIALALMYLWRKKLFPDIKSVTANHNLLIGAIAGILVFSQWYILIILGILQPEQINIFALWEGVRAYIIIVFIAVTFTLIFPIANELFWRAFLLRYFIKQDFMTIPIGYFNAFSFVMVIILSGLPTSNYTLHLVISNIIYTSLVLWRKNIYCSIIAHTITNAGILFISIAKQTSFY